MDSRLLLLLILIFLSAFFSGSEIALVSLSKAKVRAMVEKGNKTAYIIQNLKSNPQKLLITILIGNNLVNIGASVITTAWITEKFGSHTLGAITGVLTLVILIFGEIFPKIFAEKFSKQYALIIARPLAFFQFVFFPIIWIFEKKMFFLMNLIGGSHEKMTGDELKAIIMVGAESGAIENEEKELIDNIMEFDEIKVSQIMTPRAKIVSLEDTVSLDEAINFIVEEGYSRIPVYHGNIDDVVGVLTVHDLLKAKKKMGNKNVPIKEVELKSPVFIPETKYLNELFKEFQWRRKHMAIIVNEHGSVTGIVTMEDLLEEIVGDIVDESDNEDIMIEKLSENSWRIDAEIDIEELNESLGTKFECEDEHKSVGYLLLDKFQKIPRKGEDIKINDFHFFIEKMEGNKIHSVRVIRVKK